MGEGIEDRAAELFQQLSPAQREAYLRWLLRLVMSQNTRETVPLCPDTKAELDNASIIE